MEETDLDREFWKHVDIGNKMPPQTADNMLIAYAYYKQAIVGDNNEERPTESSNVIRTFKYDAWKRLQGMPKNKAKQKYIETIKELQKEQEKE